MKKSLLILMLTLMSLVAGAQESVVSGLLYDRDTKEGIIQATVQLLKMDSTYVAGAVSDIDGKFSVSLAEPGKYIVKITSVGYQPLTKNVTVSADKELALGNLQMKADAIMLKGTVVEGHAAKVVLKEDTFQYNASAYRVPEGSTVEALVKRLPGADRQSEVLLLFL